MNGVGIVGVLSVPIVLVSNFNPFLTLSFVLRWDLPRFNRWPASMLTEQVVNTWFAQKKMWQNKGRRQPQNVSLEL